MMTFFFVLMLIADAMMLIGSWYELKWIYE